MTAKVPAKGTVRGSIKGEPQAPPTPSSAKSVKSTASYKSPLLVVAEGPVEVTPTPKSSASKSVRPTTSHMSHFLVVAEGPIDGPPEPPPARKSITGKSVKPAKSVAGESLTPASSVAGESVRSAKTVTGGNVKSVKSLRSTHESNEDSPPADPDTQLNGPPRDDYIASLKERYAFVTRYINDVESHGMLSHLAETEIRQVFAMLDRGRIRPLVFAAVVEQREMEADLATARYPDGAPGIPGPVFVGPFLAGWIPLRRPTPILVLGPYGYPF
ncbi:hypothetical protein LTR62_005253 [Meristemomyces frigidus]|uniref:Uncharacterized protein n=1 Tax=Meristemomyces frigidus TaxID=1508187 RepID=A0AAN7TPZ1_9PEZI|nr:hypothetical protein LTR62_005253 [Meristemomyces frigidus]